MIMEKFMLIFHGGNSPEIQNSPELMQAQMGKWFEWINKLRKDGTYLSGEPLLPGGKLVIGPNKSVTDGPYLEGKEVVGGFIIINAKDFNQAAEISKGCPDFQYNGSVQVRQVMKMDM